ncbi:MAG TPA: ATP-binding cassette domain-containing protein [Rhizomicrobium sp.]|jgi:molybdate transport system ATP-binding protein|nr:ATP-binding cassette domain-containing protein [Rhizomicrobium sp.]
MKSLEADIEFRQGAFSLRARFIAPGEGITVLFGPSGSGKTTLLSLLAGLHRPDRGAIRLDGIDISNLASHRRGTGLVFQDARLFPHLTVRQNIAYAARRAPQGGLQVEEAVRVFDITTLLDRPVGNLSGGEKSRVALARALASRPDFLLLDEPFAALDGIRRRAFIATLSDMHGVYNLPMLVVTHNIDDAAALASHLVAIRDGAVVASGDFAIASREAAFQSLLDERDTGAAIPAQMLRAASDNRRGAIWLRADQVMLAAEPPRALSARNVLEGRVTSLWPESDQSVLVEVAAPVGSLLSRVTPQAARELELVPGRPVWAIAKAHLL